MLKVAGDSVLFGGMCDVPRARIDVPAEPQEVTAAVRSSDAARSRIFKRIGLMTAIRFDFTNISDFRRWETTL